MTDSPGSAIAVPGGNSVAIPGGNTPALTEAGNVPAHIAAWSGLAVHAADVTERVTTEVQEAARALFSIAEGSTDEIRRLRTLVAQQVEYDQAAGLDTGMGPEVLEKIDQAVQITVTVLDDAQTVTDSTLALTAASSDAVESAQQRNAEITADYQTAVEALAGVSGGVAAQFQEA